MEDLKHGTYVVKAKGSMQLRQGLKYGDVRAIALHFKMPYANVHSILCGKHAGDKRLVECAERIVNYYNEVELDNTIESIIKSYETTN